MTVVWPNCSLLPAEDAFGCAEAFENAPKLSSATETAARARVKASKTRRLKKADCEVEFLFIVEVVEVVEHVEVVGGVELVRRAILRSKLLKNQSFSSRKISEQTSG